MARRRRAVTTRSQTRKQKLVRLQPANAGTKKRPVKGWVLGPQNQNWAEREGGVQRPRWLTPKKPTWVEKFSNTFTPTRLGIGTALAAWGYNTFSKYKNYTDNYQVTQPKPLAGYLDKVNQFKTVEKQREMAPIRLRKMAGKKRRVYRRRPMRTKRRISRRRPRMMRRRGRRYPRSEFFRLLRKSTKRIRMGHYTSMKRYEKCCDVLELGEYDATLGGVEHGGLTYPERPTYYNLQSKLSELPNLMKLLKGDDKEFLEFRIDKVTLKVTVLNARAIAMDPNFRAPDGSGYWIPSETLLSEVANKQFYVNNTYVIHRRIENDAPTTVIQDWKKLQNASKGSIKFVNLFRQRGKMFQLPVTCGRTDRMIINETEVGTRKEGYALGWKQYTEDLDNIRIGNAGLILPALYPKGWDETTANIAPKLSVSVRVCSSVRKNVNSVDVI